MCLGEARKLVFQPWWPPWGFLSCMVTPAFAGDVEWVGLGKTDRECWQRGVAIVGQGLSE